MRLDKRVNDLEKKSAPEKLPIPEIVMVSSQDHVHNQHMYNKVLFCDKGFPVYKLVPKPGYTPPDDPHEVNEHPLPNN